MNYAFQVGVLASFVLVQKGASETLIGFIILSELGTFRQ